VCCRGCTREIEIEGGGVEVDDDGREDKDDSSVLRVRDEAVVHSEVGVEAVVCSKNGDEAAACFGAGVEDGKRR
jgi:hypothetical protein